MTRQRLVVSAVLAGILVVAGASASAPAAHPDLLDRDLDLVASAHPSAAEPTVADDAFAAVVARWRSVKADVTATGSATCDGCDAVSTALQVLYVTGGREARLDNSATAWTQDCTACATTALSVQVVVLRGVPSIVPNNRALAVNAACAGCRATGVALQLVVAPDRPVRLSGDEVAALRAWVAEQAAALHTPPPVPAPSADPTQSADPSAEPAPASRVGHRSAARRAKRTAGAALVTLEDLVTGDLGAGTVSSDVDVRLD